MISCNKKFVKTGPREPKFAVKNKLTRNDSPWQQHFHKKLLLLLFSNMLLIYLLFSWSWGLCTKRGWHKIQWSRFWFWRHEIQQRSSSSHVFTNPESTIFFHKIFFVLFFYEVKIYWDKKQTKNKCQFNHHKRKKHFAALSKQQNMKFLEKKL